MELLVTFVQRLYRIHISHNLKLILKITFADNFSQLVIIQHVHVHVRILYYTKGVNPCSNMGGDNIGEKYTSRLRDVLRGAKRRAFIGGFGGMPPPRKLF